MRVISGGQTGVDRGALDAALATGVPCGGWCPRGRRAEDGPVPSRYPLRELPGGYTDRTRANVVRSDATLVLHFGRLFGGTATTVRFARRWRRPTRIVDLSAAGADLLRYRVAQWLLCERIRTLNVAGPRERQVPGAAAAARRWLTPLLRTVAAGRRRRNP